MENEDNSRMDGLDNIQNGLAQQHKMQLSSKATAFSIAAIIGGGNTSNTIGHLESPNDEQHPSTIAPLGKILFCRNYKILDDYTFLFLVLFCIFQIECKNMYRVVKNMIKRTWCNIQ